MLRSFLTLLYSCGIKYEPQNSLELLTNSCLRYLDQLLVDIGIGEILKLASEIPTSKFWLPCLNYWIWNLTLDQSSDEVFKSYLSIVISSFSHKIKGSKTATKVFGKTGVLKLVDMRTRKGIAIKKMWTLGVKKLRKNLQDKLIEFIDQRISN